LDDLARNVIDSMEVVADLGLTMFVYTAEPGSEQA
jgi:hypothetical protein